MSDKYKFENPFHDDVYLERTSKKNTDIRGDYFRDQTAIIHSRPFRRLKNKTQVFFAPKDDHICTRIEHVLHVATIAGTICRGLNKYDDLYNLDVDLAFAIGLGHDIGHAPFGHAGEEAINEYLRRKKSKFRFVHEIHSYRVVEYLANSGKGLNLTFAVKDGIICHNGEKFERSLKPSEEINKLDKIKKLGSISNSYEGCIVRQSDKIAYLGRDIEDALIANLFSKDKIPRTISKILGGNNGEIINTLVTDLIDNSKDGKIRFSQDCSYIMKKLSKFNNENIYNNKVIGDYREYCKKIINTICEHLEIIFKKNEFKFEKYYSSNLNIDKLFGSYLKNMNKFYKEEQNNNDLDDENLRIRIIVDYVAGMTDVYALDCMKELSIPKPIEFVHIKPRKNIKDIKRY